MSSGEDLYRELLRTWIEGQALTRRSCSKPLGSLCISVSPISICRKEPPSSYGKAEAAKAWHGGETARAAWIVRVERSRSGSGRRIHAADAQHGAPALHS